MISVTVLTKNSEKHLKKVLDSLKAFDDVVVYDTGSSDSTMDIARTYSNVRLVEGPFEGFGLTHNQASSVAKYDWVLSIDSDEVLSVELVEEIKALKLNPKSVYSVPRNNYYNGKWIRWCGWYPDRVYRLYNRLSTSFCDSQVHETVITKDLNTVSLKHPLVHYPYENISDFIDKMQRYSELFANQNAGVKNATLATAIGHGSFAFFKSYILKRGFLGGKEGWIISSYNAITAYYKYLKLAERSKKSTPSH